jgi:hypothetical protein
LGRRGEEPRYLPDPVSTLTVSIAAPASVTAGRDLDYVVTLDNSGSSDVALEPCPNFLQALGGNVVKERHRLNCAAAHPVPAGGVETFRMRMHIPADTPPGRIMLRWFMERATTESPQATVVITTP